MTYIPGNNGNVNNGIDDTGPVRKKKEPNLIQSIIGVFVGIGIILFSPLLMWQAESQHTAKEFASANSVEASEAVDGYVTFSGEPSFDDTAVDCESGGEGFKCIYEKKSVENLVTTQELVCQNNLKGDEMTRILERDGSECDDAGNCTPCYQVEKDSWEVQSESSMYNSVIVGAYTINPDGALFMNTREQIEHLEYPGDSYETDEFYDEYYDTHRVVYTVFDSPDKLLVAGQSVDGVVNRPAENVYVISQFDAATTLANLESRDSMNKWLYRFATFFMLFVGFGMVFGPLHWFGRKFARLPLVGKFIADGSKAIISLISFVLAGLFFIVEFVAVTVIKHWWVILIVFALIIGGVYLWTMYKDKKSE